ncbi:MAG: hypothetical protein OHK0024_06580 [Thalassobaculales bacterium]
MLRLSLAAALAGAGPGGMALAEGGRPGGLLRFGLTPVFLDNDLDLLADLRRFLEHRTGAEVVLVQRRTYEEITSLLVSGQLTAAWICGYPFVTYADQLAVVAAPVWRGRPLYQSYLIVAADREAGTLEDLEGDTHAFSDPNSNSGYLVTRAMLAERRRRPEGFFSRTFFTYSHRNVVRAVATGLAQSGSVDGYVWEVIAGIEPELARRTRVMRRSEWLGFPPVACLRRMEASREVAALRRALVGMVGDATGAGVLRQLRLDGFAEVSPALYDDIAAKVAQVRAAG